MATPTSNQPHLPSSVPILDSLSVLGSGSSSGCVPVGGARDVAMSLSHVLSGLQEKTSSSGACLQGPPDLTHGSLNAIRLDDVSSDPESLRFQYTPEDIGLPQTTTPPKIRKKTVYREQDRFLPLHNVARSMRNGIPPNGKVSKDAKECMQECVSECISFITSEASDKCIAEKRKTITGDDILFAMATLGFDNYVEPLRCYLQKFREYSRAEKVNTGQSSNVIVNSNNFPSGQPTITNHTHMDSTPPPHLPNSNSTYY